MKTWFLRKPEGQIFGPVAETELLRWASGDQIGPDDTISSDRKDWLAAPQMPGLKLWWMIEWPDGHRAGPYHVSSLAEMLADGELDGHESVRHVHTRQSSSLLQTLQNALLAGELRLGEGALTAALCNMIRGGAEPSTAGSPTEPPSIAPASAGGESSPAEIAAPKPPRNVTRIAVPRRKLEATPEEAAATAAVAEAAQRLHVEVADHAE